MIIVTGTKRSGTSMWMQILAAAGIHVLGDKFPRIWKETIYEANPHGFYESHFRNGIYYRTNPNPKTGHYMRPDVSRDWAVKVFVPGLCRSDVAYVGRVVGTVRDWREYGSSLERLFALEDAALEKRRGQARPKLPRLQPLLEWWLENFLLVRDVATRGYPARLVSYDRVLSEPETWIPRMLKFVGVGDVERALEAVDPAVRTAHAANVSTTDELAPRHREAFDALYAVAHEAAPLTPALIETLNAVHAELIDEIESQLETAYQARRKNRAKAKAKVGASTEPEGTPPGAKRSDVDLVDRLADRSPEPDPAATTGDRARGPSTDTVDP